VGYSERIEKNGYWEKGVFDILYSFVTNFNAFITKINTDTGDTAISASYPITDPSIGNTYGKDIQYNAMPQGKVNDLLKAIRTNFNAVLDILAADDGVAGTTIFTTEKFSTTEHLIDVPNARIKQRGEWNDEIAMFLDDLIDRWNRVL